MANRGKVDKVTAKIIHRLENQRETSAGKAALAALRRSAGRSFAGAEAVWPMLLEQIPEELLSENGVPTPTENAIFVALQLYALCQQGSRRISGLPAEEKPSEASFPHTRG